MRDAVPVRTTLDLDAEVLQAAKEIAAARGESAGKVVSDLLRKALAPAPSRKTRNGVPLITRGANVPPLTMAAVNRMLEE
ncbi:MAG: CopG family transcriptional regulator [Vicinamibacterales bacterium]